jgi:hypothetical protein
MLPQLTLPVVTVTVISPLQVMDARTPDQQWFDGFHQYSDDVRSGDFCSAEELAAMTPQERKGYRDAISAADYAEWSAYREGRNSFCDRTEY